MDLEELLPFHVITVNTHFDSLKECVIVRPLKKIPTDFNAMLFLMRHRESGNKFCYNTIFFVGIPRQEQNEMLHFPAISRIIG